MKLGAYKIKSYLSYIGLLLAAFFYFSTFEHKNVFAIAGLALFVIFRFGEKIAGFLFSIAFLAMMGVYYYDSSLIDWKWILFAGVALLALFLLGRSPKKLDFLRDNKEKNCPRCNGTGRQVIYSGSEPYSRDEICAFCNGSGKFSM
jgi:hypothetical protein